MPTQAHREGLLTEEERAAFERDGYLRIDGALSPDAVGALESLVDEIYGAHRTAGFDPYTQAPFDPHRPFFFPNFLGRGQAFVNLLDHAATFPKVVGILGWNIYCYHSHFIVTPPRTAAERQTGRFGFHQDSGRVNVEMEGHPRPRLSVKVVFWLSDCSEDGRANLYFVPGSHTSDEVALPPDGTPPEGAVPVLGKPGDALIFDRRLWHSSSPNRSEVTRKGLFYGYGYRWLRPKDDMTIPDEVMAANDPIRRQLLGASPDNNRRFSPRDGDVPLKSWLEESD